MDSVAVVTGAEEAVEETEAAIAGSQLVIK